MLHYIQKQPQYREPYCPQTDLQQILTNFVEVSPSEVATCAASLEQSFMESDSPVLRIQTLSIISSSVSLYSSVELR